MTITPVLNAAPVWQPSDNGLLLATCDPATCTGSVVVNNTGFLHFFRMPVRSVTPVSKIWFGMSTAGVGASTGSFVGLYDPNGNRLATSADIGAALIGAAGMVSVPMLGGPINVTPPYTYAAIVTNLATTGATLVKTNALQAMLNVNQTAAQFRSSFQGTANTSLPLTVNLGTGTVEQGLWFGAS